MSNYLKKSAYSLEQAANIIGCDKTDLIDLAADREARIHVFTGGRTHFFTFYFNKDDIFVREMKQLPEICLVPVEHWKRTRAGENPELNSLTDEDSKNSIDGIGDIPYLGPWYDLAGREIKLTQFIILPDELKRLLDVLKNQKTTSGKKDKLRDEIALKLIQEYPTLSTMDCKRQIRDFLQKNNPLFCSGFEDWWKQNKIFPKGKAGRPSQQNQ